MPAKPLKIEDLNKLYDDAKAVDREAIAEMRSNILLIAGEHYSKRMTEAVNMRGRVTGQAPESYRLRITKNWLSRAQRLYVNSIISQSPGVAVTPRNQTELQDQKSAELNQAVWDYAKDKYKLKPMIRYLCGDFCGTGEVAMKVFFDKTKGKLKGYEALTDETTGETLLDDMGQPQPDEDKPVFTGEFVFERIYAHTLFRDASAKAMDDARFLGIEKLENSGDLKKRYAGDKDKLKYIDESNEDFVIFDSNKNGYSKSKDQTLIREYFWKPCMDYPNGWYVVSTKCGILEEGELPQGIFPIRWKGFDESPTKARASSFVKTARPWQAEINRASSQAALHSVTIGEDKILYQAGTKVAQGSLLPGVRGLTYQGAAPTILPGRTGEQFFPYIAVQEQEMNRALLLDVLNQEKNANLDPFSMLFTSMQQTQAFSLYSTKFGEFLVEICELYLDLARYYLEGDELIAAVGRAEFINVQEFKSTKPLNYLIKLEEQTDSMESKLGKQLTLNHILQYVGQQMTREDIGKLITQMPFGNWEESFSDFTIDEKNVKNDFLAMERGEQPMISENDDSKYSLKQVAKRKKERDFKTLPPQVQQLYQMYEQYHQQKMASEAAALKQAESEFIPASGAMIACDMYVANEDPTKTPKRVRVPYQALDWLVKMLEKQGMGMDALESMNQAQVAQVTQMLMGQRQGMPQQLQGQASPQGA
jgi:hypothetical protein